MEDKDLGRYTASFGVSLGITCMVSALLVILKELSEHSVLVWMKSATGHHWVTHGLFDLVVFVVLGLLLAQANQGSGITISEKGLVSVIVGGVVLGGLIIAGFYLIAG
jgi:hypothetical protein